MRQLTNEETTTMFKKFTKYLGENTQLLLENNENPIVFRILHEKVYMISIDVWKFASNFGNKELRHAGNLIGKFSKKGKFRINITALYILSKFSNKKVWLKQSGEQHFVYGNHVLKAHIAKMTENLNQFDGVIVYNMNEIPLGFGLMSQNSEKLKNVLPTEKAVLNQADIGEYLRTESNNNKNLNNDEDIE